MICTGLLLSADRGTAAPFYDAVGNDDFVGAEIWVFRVIDDLVGGFLAQLEGIDVYCGQLGRGQLGIEGIVEGDDGKIPGDGQSFLDAGPFQSQSQNVITDHKGRGAVFLA